MTLEIAAYNANAPAGLAGLCDALAAQLDAGLEGAEARVWHRTAVWFLAGNPVVGYAPRKVTVQLLFWSGQDFDEPGLSAQGKFKAAEVLLSPVTGLPQADLPRWLEKAQAIQWDYANIVRRKGVLEKLGDW